MVDHRRVVRRRTEAYGHDPLPSDRDVVVSEFEHVEHRPSGTEMLRRVIVFIFGVIQVLLVLRILGQLVDAQRSNDLVRFVYDISAILVAPFEGIIRTEAVEQGASVLDVTAIVALIGWTLLELLIVAAIGILRREPA